MMRGLCRGNWAAGMIIATVLGCKDQPQVRTMAPADANASMLRQMQASSPNPAADAPGVELTVAKDGATPAAL